MRVIAIVFGIFTLGASLCLGATIYVDQSGGGDYLTIRDGVRAAANGDSILVAPGTYSESFVIRTSISLISTSGKDVTHIHAAEPTYAIRIEDCAGVLVAGFTVTPHEDTSVSKSIGMPRAGVTIVDCRFPTACYKQIHCFQSDGVSVSNCEIAGNIAVHSEESSIELRGNVIVAEDPLYSVYCNEGTSTITDNTLTCLCASGINMRLTNQDDIAVSRNVISGGKGISVASSPGIVSENTIIVDCVEVLSTYGISIHPYLTTITIENNDITGGCYGVLTASVASGATVRGNVIIGATLAGILMDDHITTIEGNDISYCEGDGILGDPGTEGVTIRGNYIHDNAGHGISCGSFSTPDSIVGNTLLRNGGDGIYLDTASSVVTRNVSVQNYNGIHCIATSDHEISHNTACRNDCVGIWLADATANVHHNIVSFNNVGGIGCMNTTAVLACNNVYDNQLGNYAGTCSDPTGTDGNISVDPCFCEGSYMIAEASPCAPDNSPEGCGLIGALDIGCGECGYPVPVVPTSWGHVKSLFRD